MIWLVHVSLVEPMMVHEGNMPMLVYEGKKLTNGHCYEMSH